MLFKISYAKFKIFDFRNTEMLVGTKNLGGNFKIGKYILNYFLKEHFFTILLNFIPLRSS